MRTKGIEISATIIFLMFSCFLGIGASGCLTLSGIDYWLIPIIGSIVGIPILLLYLYIFNNKKNIDINNLNIYLFGNIKGKLLNIMLLLFIISFNLIIFYNLTSFVTSQYLYSTPAWFINILFIIPIIYVISKGPRIMFRVILVFFYFFIFLYLISFLGLSMQIKFSNVMPFLNKGIVPVLRGTINYIAYMITPIFFILIIPKKEIDDKNLNKKIIISYIIGNILLFLVMFTIVSVFGIELTQLYEYPAYHILKRVFVGGFIERMENTLSIGWLIVLFISVMFSYYYSFKTIKDNFKIKDKISFFIIIVILLFSQFIFKNNTLSQKFLTFIYPYFMLFFLIIFPLITAIKLKKSQ